MENFARIYGQVEAGQKRLKYVKIQPMSRKIIGLLLMLCCLACARPKIRQTPTSGACFQSLSIKFNFSDHQDKQNGRINWRFDKQNSKILFFTPFNQVGLELDVAGESSLLLRPGKKLYWQGDFSLLLKRLWGIDLTLEELKQLLTNGLIPEAKIREKGIVITLETNAKDLAPQIVNIKQSDAILILKVLKKDIRPGSIVLLDYDQRFQPAELEDVLADD